MSAFSRKANKIVSELEGFLFDGGEFSETVMISKLYEDPKKKSYYTDEYKNWINFADEVISRVKIYAPEEIAIIDRFENCKNEVKRLQGILKDFTRIKKYEELKIKMKTLSKESDFRNLANEFRKYDFKDSKRLATRCENKANEIVANEKKERQKTDRQNRKNEYEVLLLRIKSASDWCDYEKIAQKIHTLNGPKGYMTKVSALAEECEALAEENKKITYQQLLSRMIESNTEEQYRLISKEFTKLGEYQEAGTKAIDCYRKADEIKAERIKEKEYNNAVLFVQKLENDIYVRTYKPEMIQNLSYEWCKLYHIFKNFGNYKESRNLTERCNTYYNEMNLLHENKVKWAQQGLCNYDGGEFGGLFVKKCKLCGSKQTDNK